MPCYRMVHTSTTKVAAQQEIASRKIPKTIYGCTRESHESTRQRVESSLPPKHKDHIASKGIYFDVALQLGAQIHPCATSDEYSGCESHSGQGMDKSSRQFQHGKNQEQEGSHSGSTKRKEESPLTLLHGFISHDTNGPNHGQTLKIPWSFLKETCMVTRHLVC